MLFFFAILGLLSVKLVGGSFTEVFNVQVDDGSSYFNGSERYFPIEVSGMGTYDFTQNPFSVTLDMSMGNVDDLNIRMILDAATTRTTS